MEALLDNDLLRKLARYDLLIEFERLLTLRGFSHPHGRIGTAPYSLRLKKIPLPASHWPDTRQGLALRDLLLKRSRGVTGAQAQSLTALNVPAFDAGEITLVAYALENPSSMVFTGDKRALRTLASHPALLQTAASMTGRCVHLEMVIRTLAVRLGWRRVTSAIAGAPAEDAALHRIFTNPTESDIKNALDASINSLAARTAQLLNNTF